MSLGSGVCSAECVEPAGAGRCGRAEPTATLALATQMRTAQVSPGRPVREQSRRMPRSVEAMTIESLPV